MGLVEAAVANTDENEDGGDGGKGGGGGAEHRSMSRIHASNAAVAHSFATYDANPIMARVYHWQAGAPLI